MTSSDQATPGSPGFLGRGAPEPSAAYRSGGRRSTVAATVLALAWANSPWRDSYEAFWGTEVALRAGDAELTLDLQHWVNDGLMALFFFVVGLGIFSGTILAVRLGRGNLPPGLTRCHIVGGAALSGIGFTISLFIVDLAFDEGASADQARVGVLAASVLAALLGCIVLRLAARRQPDDAGCPEALDPPVAPDRDHIRGPVEAPLTLVEYGDFPCPFCSRATGSMQQLHDRFGDRFRYVFRHAPLAELRPDAQLAAEAAATQGRFWDMHDRLFAEQGRLSITELLEHAAALGLDVERFVGDLHGRLHTRRVQYDVDSAHTSGVIGTPTFFVAGRRHTGPFDADTLAAALLAEADEGTTKRVRD